MINKSTKIFTLALMLSASGGVFAAAIHDAVYTNDIGRIQKAVRDDPNSLYSMDANGQTPIHIAIFNNSIAGLTALMNNGPVNLNIQNQDGETPLVYAIKLNKYNPILFLLQKGSNPYYVDNNGRDALYYVKRFGDPSTKMIFDEVIKYQEEKLQQQKKLIASGSSSQSNTSNQSRLPPRLAQSKDGKKTAEELIAENAVQRELLGQTNNVLNNDNTNANASIKNNTPDDLDSTDVVKTNPVKDNGFVYKNDVKQNNQDDDLDDAPSAKTDAKNKEIEALAAQVEKLTELIKTAVNKPKQENNSVDNVSDSKLPNSIKVPEKPIIAQTDDSKNYNYDYNKKDDKNDEKIKDFIKLNQTIGNDVPEKYDTSQKGPYTGIYKTQEKEEQGQEKDVIPDNWQLTEDKKDNTVLNIPESGEQSAIPSSATNTENSEINNITLVEPQKAIEVQKPIEVTKEPETNKLELLKNEIVEDSKEKPKDIPTMIAQKTIEAPVKNAVTADKVKPLITENESKSIEEKINANSSSERSSGMNIFLSALVTLLMIGSIYGAYLLFLEYKKHKNKNKETKEIKDKEAEKNRDEIKNRLVPKKPWENKKPD